MARRSRRPDIPALVGSAHRLPKETRRLVEAWRPVSEWQTEAWDLAESIPEAGFVNEWVGQLVSKADFYVAVEDADGNPQSVTDAVADGAQIPAAALADAADAMAALGDGPGGVGGLMRELAINLDVAGDCHMIRWAQRTATDPDGTTRVLSPPRTEIVSVNELKKAGESLVVERDRDRPQIDREELQADRDDIVRLWQPHARFGSEAQSAYRHLIGVGRTLRALADAQLSTILSRSNAGMLIIPNEVSDGAPQPVPPIDPDTGLPVDGVDDEQDDPFYADLTTAIVAPASDPGHPSSQVPFLARMPGDRISQVKHITFARSDDGTLDAKLEAAVNRWARGTNAPVEVVLGHQSTTFANAAQISADELNQFIGPRLELYCDLLTEGWLQPAIADPEWSGRMFIWYDASRLTGDSVDRSTTAPVAHAAGVLSDAALRRHLGFTEDDAPTPDEVVQRRQQAALPVAAQIAAVMAPSAQLERLLTSLGVTFDGDVDVGNPPRPGVSSPPPVAATHRAVNSSTSIAPYGQSSQG